MDVTARTANAGANQTVNEDTTVDFNASTSTDNGQVASSAWVIDDCEWTALDTTVVSTANGEIITEATSPGFSLFAVGSDAQEATPGTDESDDEPGSPSGITLFVLLVGAVVVVALAVVAVRRRS